MRANNICSDTLAPSSITRELELKRIFCLMHFSKKKLRIATEFQDIELKMRTNLLKQNWLLFLEKFILQHTAQMMHSLSSKQFLLS